MNDAKRWLSGFTIVVAASSMLSCLGGTCTLIGCSSVEELTISVPGTLEELQSAEAVACRNDVCWRGSLDVGGHDFTTWHNAGVALTPDGDPGQMRAEAALKEERDGSLSLDVTWYPGDYRTVRAGDTLGVGVNDETGASVVDVHVAVGTPHDLYPNGERCDDTPCRQAIIDRRAGQGS